MDETMGDLASLKRPALQKLCKKFGIKANGKVRLEKSDENVIKICVSKFRTLI